MQWAVRNTSDERLRATSAHAVPFELSMGRCIPGESSGEPTTSGACDAPAAVLRPGAAPIATRKMITAGLMYYMHASDSPPHRMMHRMKLTASAMKTSFRKV
jgi:hypothetical protein